MEWQAADGLLSEEFVRDSWRRRTTDERRTAAADAERREFAEQLEFDQWRRRTIGGTSPTASRRTPDAHGLLSPSHITYLPSDEPLSPTLSLPPTETDQLTKELDRLLNFTPNFATAEAVGGAEPEKPNFRRKAPVRRNVRPTFLKTPTTQPTTPALSPAEFKPEPSNIFFSTDNLNFDLMPSVGSESSLVSPGTPSVTVRTLESIEEPVTLSGEVAGQDLMCCVCFTTSTGLWRKRDNNELLCNACGLYERLNRKPRPAHLHAHNYKKRSRRGGSVRASPHKPGSLWESTAAAAAVTATTANLSAPTMRPWSRSVSVPHANDDMLPPFSPSPYLDTHDTSPTSHASAPSPFLPDTLRELQKYIDTYEALTRIQATSKRTLNSGPIQRSHSLSSVPRPLVHAEFRSIDLQALEGLLQI